jgi:hypothetical protein
MRAIQVMKLKTIMMFCDTVVEVEVEVEASDNVPDSDKHDLEVCAVTISGLKFLTLNIKKYIQD